MNRRQFVTAVAAMPLLGVTRPWRRQPTFAEWVPREWHFVTSTGRQYVTSDFGTYAYLRSNSPWPYTQRSLARGWHAPSAQMEAERIRRYGFRWQGWRWDRFVEDMG